MTPKPQPKISSSGLTDAEIEETRELFRNVVEADLAATENYHSKAYVNARKRLESAYRAAMKVKLPSED